MSIIHRSGYSSGTPTVATAGESKNHELVFKMKLISAHCARTGTMVLTAITAICSVRIIRKQHRCSTYLGIESR
ncbi:hypothetical protein BDV98DRAFT_82718 [Pterulicium gracile]|uniref:Uncharacterized protein n=1 Tax=Pterulicium gracile TaxID=1884261 RepID=A0A5C3QHM0_9AGAR|nr:hypothetical protein BDV98DRAFT_82718 [Pterula gracilis]